MRTNQVQERFNLLIYLSQGFDTIQWWFSISYEFITNNTVTFKFILAENNLSSHTKNKNLFVLPRVLNSMYTSTETMLLTIKQIY